MEGGKGKETAKLRSWGKEDKASRTIPGGALIKPESGSLSQPGVTCIKWQWQAIVRHN